MCKNFEGMFKNAPKKIFQFFVCVVLKMVSAWLLWTSPAEKTGSAVFSASPPKNRRGVVGFLSGDLAFFKQEFYPLLVAYYPEQVVSQKYNRGIRVQYALSISFYTYYESVGAFSYSGVFY